MFCKETEVPLSALSVLQNKPYKCRCLSTAINKVCLKCVFLHNGSTFACVPIGHSVIMKEHYLTVKMVLRKLCDKKHKWVISVNLKMASFLLGQQGGYFKYAGFLCWTIELVIISGNGKIGP